MILAARAQSRVRPYDARVETAMPQNVNVFIRSATLDDAAAIAELSGQLGYPASSREIEERLAKICGHPQHGIFVAESIPEHSHVGGAAKVIGWLHVCERPLVEADLRAEVNGLVVGEGFRRTGAGRLLMQRAEQWAREHACRAVMLRSNVIRADAHAFYEALGYRTTKTQKAFLKEL